MNTTYIPIPNELMVELITRYKEEYSHYVEHAIESFLERTEEGFMGWESSIEGIFWDPLFLPERTELRTKYKGEVLIAKIKKGKVEYKNKTYDTPSKASYVMRGNISNNAWMTLEVKRPQDVSFKKADRFRNNR